MSYLHAFPGPAIWAFLSLLDSSGDAGGAFPSWDILDNYLEASL